MHNLQLLLLKSLLRRRLSKLEYLMLRKYFIIKIRVSIFLALFNILDKIADDHSYLKFYLKYN